MSCLLVNCLSARTTLGVMAFFMFLVTQMIRVNLYIALVPISEKYDGSEAGGKNIWNENASSLILGAFYWSYWATELPGGLLAQRYGGKKIIGVGVTLSAILNLLLPAACHFHYLLASCLRALQGLSLGVTWPVMHWLSGRWIPQSERSKFMTSYHGAAVGNAITFPISGLIISHYGWNYVFYLIGIITLAWSFAWWILVFDSPQQHPRLSEKERKYLSDAIGDLVVTSKTQKTKTPWKQICNSKPFWAVLMASQGLMWGTITLSMQIPTYYHQVHHLDIKSTGFLSGIPEVCKFLFAVMFSSAMDKLINNKTFPVTIVRKFAVGVSEYLPACFLILLGLYGHKSAFLATVLLTCTSMVGGGSSSGSLPNIVDLSPNHAGALLGLIKTLTIIPGVLSPLIVTYLLSDSNESKINQWRTVFMYLAVAYIIFCSIFMFFGSGKIQPWNSSIKQPEEASILKTKESEQKPESEENDSLGEIL